MDCPQVFQNNYLMPTPTHQLHLQLRNKQNQPLPRYLIKAFDIDRHKNDFLGEAITDQDGKCTIAFDQSQFDTEPREKVPDIFFTVSRDGVEIHNFRNEFVIPLRDKAQDVVLYIDADQEEEEEDEFPVGDIPLRPQDWKGSLENMDELPEETQSYIQQQLNQYLNQQLINAIPISGPDFEQAVQDLQLNYQDHTGETLGELINATVRPALEEVESLKEQLNQIPPSFVESKTTPLSQVLQLDTPIKTHPVLSKDVEKVKAHLLGEVAGLGKPNILQIIDKEVPLHEATETHWDQWVDDGTIAPDQAEGLQTALNYANLTGENFPLIHAIQGKPNIARPSDLAQYDVHDWEDLIDQAGGQTPNGESQEAYAQQLDQAVQDTFPAEYLIDKVIKRGPNGQLDAIKKVKRLFTHNDKILDKGKPVEINWKGVPKAKRKELQEQVESLAGVVNTYKDLGVEDILNDKNRDPQQKAEAIQEKIQQVDQFLENNPDIDLKTVDLSSSQKDHYQWKGIPASEQEGIRQQLKSYQRVVNLAPRYDVSSKLLAKRYDSAQRIINRTPEFLAKDTGLEPDTAQRTYDKAAQTMTQLTHWVTGFRDLMDMQYLQLPVDNSSPELLNLLRKFDGYESLFGASNNCDCTHCKSIYSPAAYFFDLMLFINNRVLAGEDENHPIHLKQRRPDLYTLQLTCEHTYKMRPTLEFINEHKIDLIQRITGGSDSFQEISQSNLSFHQPAQLPFEELKLYLPHFDYTLYELYQLAGVNATKKAIAYLGINALESDVITRPDSSGVGMRYCDPSDLTQMEVCYFMKVTGLEREEVDTLIHLKIIQDISPVEVKREKDTSDIQKYYETIINLNEEVLDVMHRLVRLWRRLPWSLLEVDLVLHWLDKAGFVSGTGNPITEGKLTAIAQLKRIQDQLALGVEDLCTLFYQIPDWKVSFREETNPYSQEKYREKVPGLFSRRFKPAELFSGTSSLTFYHPHFDTVSATPSDPDVKLPILLSGLGMAEDDLLRLMEFYPNFLGTAPSGETELDREKISQLYRIRTLAKGLGLSMTEMLWLMKILFPSEHPVSKLIDHKQLIDTVSRIRKTPFTLNELWFMLTGGETAAIKYAITEEGLATLVGALQTEEALYFDHESLVVLEGVSEAEAKGLLDQLKTDGLLELETSLNKYYCISNLISEADLDVYIATVSDSEIKTKLERARPFMAEKINSFHYASVTRELMAEQFNLSLEMIEALRPFHGLSYGASGFLQALRAPLNADGQFDDPSDAEELMNLFQRTQRLTLLFSKLSFEAGHLHFIVTQPGIFAIADLEDLNLANVLHFHTYQTWLFLQNINGEVVEALLTAYENANTLVDDPGAGKKELSLFAELLETSKTTVSAALDRIFLPDNTLDTFDHLKAVIRACEQLGVQAHFLEKATADSYTETAQARDLLLAAFRSKHADEEAWEKAYEPFYEKLLETQRDMLCDYLLSRKTEPRFEDENDLSAYLLEDVKISGCGRISRLKQAINSVQLYGHRCLLNLEQTVDGSFHVQVLANLAKQWEWRKNYRLWEANRKVFLYPENWIEPELRDLKSPEFEELEDELLQQNITEESATEAYAEYLKKLAELGSMVVSGVYYFKGNESLDARYYIFARTSKDPYEHSYRELKITYDALNSRYVKSWTPYQKVDLTINARKVSPVYFKGRLYLFWMETNTREVSSFAEGDSQFDYYLHEPTAKYSYLNESGRWMPPQSLSDFLYNYDKEWGFRDGVDPTELGNPYRMKNNKRDYYFNTKTFNKLYPIATADSNSRLYFEYIRQLLKTEKVNDSSNSGGTSPGSQSGLGLMMGQGSGIKQSWVSSLFPLNPFEKWENIPALEVSTNYVNLFRNDTEPSDVYTLGITKAIKLLPSGDEHLQLFFDGIPPARPYDGYSRSEGYIDMEIEDEEYVTSGKIGVTATINKKDCDPKLTIVHNSFYLREREPGVTTGDFLFTNKGQQFLFYRPNLFQAFWETERLTTSVPEELGTLLLERGIDSLLSLNTQKMVKEAQIGLAFQNPGILAPPQEIIDNINFGDAFGQYKWEIFFHIPFLIANQLNKSQKYKEAQKWYHYIFNPTAAEDPWVQQPTDRNWQFVLFRTMDIPKLRDILTDGAAIQVYENDPFNPHAIARLRISADARSVVMKYIDNLIDWGDQLFTRDTHESINEATMLYVLASDILGPEPCKTGKCETVDESQITYEHLRDNLEEGSPFLIEAENYIWVSNHYQEQGTGAAGGNTSGSTSGNKNKGRGNFPVFGINNSSNGGSGRPSSHAADPAFQVNIDLVLEGHVQVANGKQLVFCTPPNPKIPEMRKRVADRLYKIRNCMNIEGVVRQLALFQPPIDPALLVRARAVGLSMEDVLGNLFDQMSPYRFSFLLQKAKEFTSTVQGLGNALQSALEKKDAEELNLIQQSHGLNMQKLQLSIRKRQIEEAKAQLENLMEAQKNVQQRVDYYNGLIETGLIPWEKTQQDSKHTASTLYAIDGTIRVLSAIMYLIPNVGFPTAFTYGGREFGNSGDAAAEAITSAAKVAEAISASAGLEAGNQRREQEWKQQLKLAQQELKQMDKQIVAAEIRLDIADKELSNQEKSLEQAEETYQFYQDKFTGLGLYNWQAGQLSRLYRQGYKLALEMAQQAEKAYHFELARNESIIKPDNWNAGYAGLGAADHLNFQLVQLDKAYLENNQRQLEVTQSFSMRQLAPERLLELQQTGEAVDFVIPEAAYDLIYPGQYRRLIKSVRITIPCVAGPNTNIPCTVALTDSKVRMEADADPSALISRPRLSNQLIATSNANNDGGAFELNFRDERYLPFEMEGAVDSTWTLSLPTQIKPFDYNTISDVIFHISYTAKYDGAFKQTVEANLLASLNGLPLVLLISLKQQMPDNWYQLQQASDGDIVPVKLLAKHFPFFASGNNGITLNLKSATAFISPNDLVNIPYTSGTNEWDLKLEKEVHDTADDVIILIEYSIS
jgi:hypothetical protein